MAVCWLAELPCAGTAVLSVHPEPLRDCDTQQNSTASLAEIFHRLASGTNAPSKAHHLAPQAMPRLIDSVNSEGQPTKQVNDIGTPV